MKLFLLAAAASWLSANVAGTTTTVSVIEIGKGGVVRRTTSPSTLSSVAGVLSLWSNIHDVKIGKRKLAQQAGMSIVPDMFQRASGGVALGVLGEGVDLKHMPFVAGLVKDSKTVGKVEVIGSQGHTLMKKAAQGTASLKEVVESISVEKNELQGVSLNVDDKDSAKKIDNEISSMVKALKNKVIESDSTMVLYIIHESKTEAKPVQRRLEDQDGDDANQNQNNYNGNAYGYFNDYGEWVTNYKTIFQIQYYNVVLWSTLGLIAVLFYSLYLMTYMPLMEDTLLFGESAKVSST